MSRLVGLGGWRLRQRCMENISYPNVFLYNMSVFQTHRNDFGRGALTDRVQTLYQILVTIIYLKKKAKTFTCGWARDPGSHGSVFCAANTGAIGGLQKGRSPNVMCE